MLFDFTTGASLLALSSFTTAATFQHKRATLTNTIDTPLYAYGEDADGARVFYHNGLAYVGDGAPGWTGTSSNITFSADSSSATVPWTISSNSTPPAFNGTQSMYIVTTSGAFTQVGFVASNASLPTGGTDTGFTFFGTSVAYVASSGEYELQFWANSTNTTGIWALYWNSNGTSVDGAFPITLKSTAPTVV